MKQLCTYVLLFSLVFLSGCSVTEKTSVQLLSESLIEPGSVRLLGVMGGLPIVGTHAKACVRVADGNSIESVSLRLLNATGQYVNLSLALHSNGIPVVHLVPSAKEVDADGNAALCFSPTEALRGRRFQSLVVSSDAQLFVSSLEWIES